MSTWQKQRAGRRKVALLKEAFKHVRNGDTLQALACLEEALCIVR